MQEVAPTPAPPSLDEAIARCSPRAPLPSDPASIEHVLTAVRATRDVERLKAASAAVLGLAAAALATRGMPFPCSAALRLLQALLTGHVVQPSQAREVFTADVLSALMGLGSGTSHAALMTSQMTADRDAVITELCFQFPQLRKPLRAHALAALRAYPDIIKAKANWPDETDVSLHTHVGSLLGLVGRFVAGAAPPQVHDPAFWEADAAAADAASSDGAAASGVWAVVLGLVDNAALLDSDVVTVLRLYSDALAAAIRPVANTWPADASRTAVNAAEGRVAAVRSIVITSHQHLERSSTKPVAVMLDILSELCGGAGADNSGPWAATLLDVAPKALLLSLVELVTQAVETPHEQLSLSALRFATNGGIIGKLVAAGDDLASRHPGFCCRASGVLPDLVKAIVGTFKTPTSVWSDVVADAQEAVLAMCAEASRDACEAAHASFSEYYAALQVRSAARKAHAATVQSTRAERAAHSRDVLSKEEANSNLQFVHGMKTLGQGAYSTVTFVKKIDRDTPASTWSEYAMKTISKKLVEEQECAEAVQRELDALTALRGHPNVVQLCANFASATNYHLVLEYCAGGDLFDAACRPNLPQLPTTACVRSVLWRVARAVAALHDAGYLVADLKAENVLLTTDGDIRVCDLGSCLRLGDLESAGNVIDAFSGTPEYMAPETLPQQADGAARKAMRASDWWAFGCLAHLLLAGFLPYRGATPDVVLAEVARDRDGAAWRDTLRTVRRVAGAAGGDTDADADGPLSTEALRLLEGLLHRDPAKRSGFDDVKAHAFFAADADAPPLVPIAFSSTQRRLPAVDFAATANADGAAQQQAVTAAVVFGRKQSMLWKQTAVVATAAATTASTATPIPAEDAATEAWASAFPSKSGQRARAAPLPSVGRPPLPGMGVTTLPPQPVAYRPTAAPRR